MTQVKRIDSDSENVTKYVFDFGDAVAETVLYRYPTFEDRTVICCSTQSGCPIGCRFCGSGDAFVRSLTAAEIVAQVSHAFTDRGIDHTKVKKCQIMFMSMGEPMLNFRNLETAICELNAMYPRFDLLISTSAPDVDYSRLIALSSKVNKVGVQFSVHESTDEERNKLIPFKKKLTLKQIAEVGEVWHLATGRRPFFNYCAHERNTSSDDATRLNELFNPGIWEATISVICERDESVAAANSRQEQLATDFMSKLNECGFSTRCFNPAGQDTIGGGCGQLWYVQDWMNKHPDLARPSVGRTIPIVHTPR